MPLPQAPSLTKSPSLTRNPSLIKIPSLISIPAFPIKSITDDKCDFVRWVEQGWVDVVARSLIRIPACATVAPNPKVAVKVNVATIFLSF
jgi:hypothetical protein